MAIIPQGGSAAAFVPYTKKRNEWIVATVIQHIPETKEYLVRDQFPDTRKKSNTYKVPENQVVAYPAPPEELFVPGDAVLSLWLNHNEWSSVFYHASVAIATDKDTLQLSFPGEAKLVAVPRSKVVKEPPASLFPLSQSDSKSSSNGSSIIPMDQSSTERAPSASTKRESESLRAAAPPLDQDPPKRHRALSPDSWASSPDTAASFPDSPHASAMIANGAVNGSVATAADGSEERVQGRGVLEKKLLKYQQLLATRKRTAETQS